MKYKKVIPSTIAIDGPAASGKSSVGKNIADALGYSFLDTGVMYRAVTLAVLKEGIDVQDEKAVGELAEKIRIEVCSRKQGEGEKNHAILLDSKDVTSQLRSVEVNNFVSQVSRYQEVRTAMTEQQKMIGKNGKIVMAGRDIGTVVLPEADIKIYLEASPKERARRRYEEEKAKGKEVALSEILKNVQMRDEIDSTRAIAPLKPAWDAHIINTDDKNIEQVTEEILKIIRN